MSKFLDNGGWRDYCWLLDVLFGGWPDLRERIDNGDCDE